MYNYQIILDLLEKNKIKNKELLEYLGKNWNGSLPQIIDADIRASKLERIADFFGVPIDTFFERESVNNGVLITGKHNQIHHFSVGLSADERKNYETLLAEKDSRIAALEDTIKILKKQIGLD